MPFGTSYLFIIAKHLITGPCPLGRDALAGSAAGARPRGVVVTFTFHLHPVAASRPVCVRLSATNTSQCFAPGSSAVDELGLVEPVETLGQRVVGVAPAADRGDRSGLGQALGITNAEILD